MSSIARTTFPFRQLLACFVILVSTALPSLVFAVGAQAIAAGGYHTCALTTAGGVQCWGYNGYGQLGDGTTVEKHTPVAVSNLSSGVVAVAASDTHSCALTGAGGVYCWGDNYYGQLGDNSSVQKLTPVAVSGLSSGVTAITVSFQYTCVLTNSGGVLCWGANYYGQLGDNTTVSKQTPVAVSGLSSGVVAIAAGFYHTCALTNAGGVQCWGSNGYGQLGDNSTVNKLTPVAVSGLSSGVVALAAGAYHTCALTNADGVKCWGYNDSGQLGDNTTVNKLTPVVVSGLSSGVVAVTAGAYHSCTLTSAGGVQCWGRNSEGQLGDNTIVNKLTPVTVSGLSSNVLAIEAGNAHTCSVTSAGGVQCWGSNSVGQLGDDTTVKKLTPANVVGFDSDGDGILDDADSDDDNDGVLDGSDNCPVTVNTDQLNTDGDAQGDVCDNDDDNDGVTDTLDPFPLNAAVSVDTDGDGAPDSWNAACDATCQANSGLVLDNCPSNANAGQLNTDGDTQGDVCDADDDNDGVPDTSDAFPLNTAENADTDNDGIGNNADPDDDNDGVLDGADNCPITANADQADVDNDGKGDVCDLAIQTALLTAEETHTCAISSTGGVQCWGSNSVGQLGDNSTVRKLTPIVVSGLSSGVVAIAGGYHTCALTNAGGVQCWGSNGSGQLGDNTTVNKLTPVPVAGLSSGVVAVAAGYEHSCALTSAGGVQCWGGNDSGQLGDNTTVDRLTPVAVNGLSSGVVAVAAGGYHTCALTTAGGVQCWGYNYKGQLGDNTTVDKLTPVAVSGLSSGVMAIAVGDYHSCALTAAGGVQCWGYNYHGQLGDNTTVNKLTPVAVSGLSSGVLTIVVGGSHTCVLSSTGGVQCWGNNWAGQLGDNTTVNKLTPVAVSGLNSGVVAIAVGTAHTCILSSAGGVKCWGDNYYGQLGDNTTANKLTPVAVSGSFWIDSDGDNVPDALDVFPLDASESLDTDADGIGNNADLDDDNDGVPDYIDANPLNAAVNSEAVLPLNNAYKGSQVRDVNAVQ